MKSWVLSWIEYAPIRSARQQLAEFVAPGLQVLAIPLAPLRRLGQHIATYASAADDIEQLRDEVRKLKGWEARARELERRLADLSIVARVVDEPGFEFITGRVIADAKGPFARSVLLNAGSDHGMRAGYPVINGDGLVGRVVESGTGSARVLLLSDLNSRIPVLIGENGTRGVLIGDNSGRPKLAHLPENARITDGDEVVTSGVGGLFPRGLRIGAAATEGVATRVELHARLDHLDHVSVLFFNSPALDLAAEVPKLPAPEKNPRKTIARRLSGASTEQVK